MILLVCTPLALVFYNVTNELWDYSYYLFNKLMNERKEGRKEGQTEEQMELTGRNE